MRKLWRRHWFLALLLVVLVVGIRSGPQLAMSMSQVPRGWIVALVMFLTALPMQFSQLTGAARSGRSVGLALVLSMLVAPPLAWLVARALPTTLAMGLVVAASVPCTLASAAVWTRRGGGNDAIALLVTLITNLACFVVLPMWLWLLLGRGEGENFDAARLPLRLLVLVVLPVALAQLLRLSKAVGTMATRHKPLLSLAAQLGVLVMVFFGAVSSGSTLAGLPTDAVGPPTWVLLCGLVLGLHLLLFTLGWFGGAMLAASRSDRLAIAIAGSQKTLMIGLDVALGIGGLAVLPMVAYHIIQLVIDTVLVDKLGTHE